MKKTIYTILFALICSVGFTQNAKEFYNSANDKFDKRLYNEAIKDYDNAVEMDKSFAEAYYNRE